MNLNEKIKESIVKTALENYFSRETGLELTNEYSMMVQKYLYQKKSKAAYILLYKYNIFKVNIDVVASFFKEINNFERSILRMRYKDKKTLFFISTSLEVDASVVYNRQKKLIRILYYLITGKITFKEIYMLSPKMLSIMETRVSMEFAYAFLGMETEDVIERLETNYIKTLEKKKEKLSFLKFLVIDYLREVKEKNSLDYKIIKDILSNHSVKREDLGKKYYISASRVVQIVNKFKETVKKQYLERKI